MKKTFRPYSLAETTVRMMIFVAIFLSAHSAFAYTYARVISLGSTGPDVAALQQALGGYPITGYFDSNTKIAVMNFQAVNNLTVDGIVGPKTGKALSPATVSTPTPAPPVYSPAPAPIPIPSVPQSCNPALDVSCGSGSMSGSSNPNFPAGCTSRTGYSVTTGVSCKFPPGCTTDTKYSSVNGARCDDTYQPSSSTSTSLPAGCTSRTGYSATTGASCATGLTNDALKGSFGSIAEIKRVSGAQGEAVPEDVKKTYIAGYSIRADEGSDLLINSLKIQFKFIGGAASTSLSRYVDTVHVLEDGREVGSAPISDFSKNGSIYEKRISLYGAVVRDDRADNFYIAVDSLDISTSNKDNAWTLTVAQVDYVDARGSKLTTTSKGDLGLEGSLNFHFLPR